MNKAEMSLRDVHGPTSHSLSIFRANAIDRASNVSAVARGLSPPLAFARGGGLPRAHGPSV